MKRAVDLPKVTWSPVEDLPVDFDELADSELQALVRVWEDQRVELAASSALKQFNERLHRSWAIETGIIEHLYSLDRGITELLIQRGIDAALIPHSATDKDPQLVADIISDHEEAIDSLFDFTERRRPLSASYIKELHALFTRHQETSVGFDQFGTKRDVALTRGDYRTTVARPSRSQDSASRYAPPEHIAAEMDRLVGMHLIHDDLGVPCEIEAAWLHHRFAQIHPFQDGNGRVARALASLIFIRAGLLPLVISGDDRDVYIDVLEAADRRDLGPLVRLFAANERQALVKALGIADTVIKQEQVDQVIAAIGDDFEARRASLQQQWERAKGIAAELHAIAIARLEGIAEKLRVQVRESNYRFRVDDALSRSDRDHYHRWQIIESAHALDYYANTNAYRSWVCLILSGESRSEILVSFHGLGYQYRGLVAASACYFRRGEGEEEGIRVTDLEVLADQVFQVNYLEEPSHVKDRFEAWLNLALVRGLEVWRRAL